jgi:hypothetical protein
VGGKKAGVLQAPQLHLLFSSMELRSPDNFVAEVAKDGAADNYDRTILACYGSHSVALGFEYGWMEGLNLSPTSYGAGRA